MKLNTRKVFTLLILFSIVTIAKAQNTYLSGSIKKKNSVTQEVLIQYKAWQYTPTKINYKLVGSEEVLYANIETLNEFTIDGKASYIAADVKIDVSSNITRQISSNREPKWENQRIFLKVIMDKGVKLYAHQTSRFERFFYQKINEEKYVQLIYKPYLSLQQHKAYNLDFRKQLKNNFQCSDLEIDYRKLEYSYKSIVRFFVNYNDCMGYEVASVEISKPKAELDFHLKGGLSFVGGSFREVNQPINRRRINSSYDPAVAITFGFDMELVLPYQGKQWSLLLSSQYEHFSTGGTFDQLILFIPPVPPNGAGLSAFNWRMNVSHITFGLGLRRSFITSENERFFINAGINSNFAIQISSNKFIGNENSVSENLNIELTERNSLYTGAGYASKKISFELRYGFGREVLSDRPNYKSKYTSIALIFGFQLSK